MSLGEELADRLVKALAPKYVISWTKPARHCQRWLFLNPEGTALLVHHAEKATRFDRDECNLILLALMNAGRWSEAGEGSYPHVEEMRS